MPLTDKELYELGRTLARKAEPREPAKIEFTVKNIEDKMDALAESVPKMDGVCEQIAVLRAAVMALADYMPEFDIDSLVKAVASIKLESVHNEVDTRDQLRLIAEKIDNITKQMEKNRLALVENTRAVEKQNEILLMDQKISYDSSGRVQTIRKMK